MFYNNFGSLGDRATTKGDRCGATPKKGFQHGFSIAYKHKLPHSLTEYKNIVFNTMNNSLNTKKKHIFPWLLVREAHQWLLNKLGQR